VTTSRPGYGKSSRDPGRSVVRAADDIAAVLAAIGAERCLMAGWSGGGPHALACAARLDAAAAVLVVAGIAPYGAEDLDWWGGMGQDNLDEFSAALEGEDKLAPYLWEQHGQLKDIAATEIIVSLTSLLPEVDRAALTDEFGEDYASSFHEGLKSGINGWLDDDLAFIRPWGFDLAEIGTPVTLWQGSADLMVPYAHGEWLASRLPGASIHLEEGEGHVSIAVGALDRMLDELVELAS
jgi:pimeloyl-ACP methyl ester carboxylesterase